MKLLSKVKQEEAKDRLVNSAFIAFQMGAGGDKTFGQYLENLGLTNGKGQTESITKEEAIAKAERIKKAIKEKRSKE